MKCPLSHFMAVSVLFYQTSCTISNAVRWRVQSTWYKPNYGLIWMTVWEWKRSLWTAVIRFISSLCHTGWKDEEKTTLVSFSFIFLLLPNEVTYTAKDGSHNLYCVVCCVALIHKKRHNSVTHQSDIELNITHINICVIFNSICIHIYFFFCVILLYFML